jgi:heat-inducible transcriptional repressor
MNIEKNKEERKLQILASIIREYVSTAVPVSSKSVAEAMGSRISSATVRNIMAELEESGYIEQPHTSAGRRPTDKGYRQFVNVMARRLEIEKEKAVILRDQFEERIRSIKDIIERTTCLISRELKHTGLVMWPTMDGVYLKHIELVRIKAKTVLAVLVTMTNAVKNYIFMLEKDIEKTQLKKISNFLSSNYEENKLSVISERLKVKAPGAGNSQVTKLASSALEIIDKIIEIDIENDVFMEGMNWFAMEPEFRDPNVSKHVLNLISDRKIFGRLMRKELPHRGVNVYIGSENESEILKDCSVITSGYDIQGETVGRFGVVGPTRMDYESILRTIGCLSDVISKKLAELSK